MNRAVKVLALMLLGVAVWETGRSQAQYGSQVRVPVVAGYYTGGDNPPAQQPQAEDRLTRIEKKLDELVLAVGFVVDAIKKAEADPVAAKGQGDPTVNAVMQLCAKCHRAEVADKNGDGFVMFDREGKFSANTVRELQNIIKRINHTNPAKVMPPPKVGVLTEAQKKAATALALADIQAQEAAKK